MPKKEVKKYLDMTKSLDNLLGEYKYLEISIARVLEIEKSLKTNQSISLELWYANLKSSPVKIDKIPISLTKENYPLAQDFLKFFVSIYDREQITTNELKKLISLQNKTFSKPQNTNFLKFLNKIGIKIIQSSSLSKYL